MSNPAFNYPEFEVTENNADFNRVEFDTVKNQSGSNAFVMTPSKWIELTKATGIQSKAGRYGGTYAHKDIAIEQMEILTSEHSRRFLGEGEAK